MGKFDSSSDFANPEHFTEFEAPKLVYVREVLAAEILEDDPIPGLEVEPDAVWYAVHAADGSRLAVLDDRDAAFMAARHHDLKPVSTH